MVIRKHKPKRAEHTDLRGALATGLDEARTALDESIHGLTDEQLCVFPPWTTGTTSSRSPSAACNAWTSTAARSRAAR